MKSTRTSCAAVLSIVLCAQQIAGGQTALPGPVSRAELRAALRSAAAQRDANVDRIRRLLRHPDVAREAARLADLTRITRALGTLDDQTLERLALQSDEVSRGLEGEGAVKVLVIVLLILIILAVVVSVSLPESS